jgi:Domain of unknown function (DUF4336)
VSTLQSFGTDLWIAEGPLVRDTGLMFTTRMTIIRLQDGSIWVESPVPLDQETLNEIRDLGPLNYAVACTQRHVWRLKGWHDQFPETQLWAPGLTSIKTKPDPIPVKDVWTDTPFRGWAEDLEQLVFRGSFALKEVLFLHRRSRTLILGDLIQVNPMLKGRPIRNLVFRLLGAAVPRGGVALDIRLSFRNKDLARQSLDQLLSWDFDKIVISHGDCVTKDAKVFIEDAFRWLTR